DDRHAGGGEASDRGEERVLLLRRQTRRRLVHDEDADVARDRDRDLDELALAEAEPLDEDARVDLVAELPQRVGGRPAGLAPGREERTWTPGAGAFEHEVLGD